MVSIPHAATSLQACTLLAGVQIVACGRLCEVNQKLTLALAERARLEFSSRGAARAVLVAPEIKEQLQ